MEEEARQLDINILITPWMFKYEYLGWGYQPSTPEQWEFLEKYCGEYSDDRMFKWIYDMKSLS